MNNMDHLLRNRAPKYYLAKGERAYVAVDSAHGGNIYFGSIAGKANVDGQPGYMFQYISPDYPDVMLFQPLMPEFLFQDLAGIDDARSFDRSVQDEAIRSACSTTPRLIAYLLGRSNLPENDLKIVLNQIEKLGLSGNTPAGSDKSDKYSDKEFLDVFDPETGQKTGTATRDDVHKKGLLHKTVRVWLVQDGMLTFQIRSDAKDLYPGLIDPACTGHVTTGESPLGAAMREIEEETGVKPNFDDLIAIGDMAYPFQRPDGRLDNEHAHLFIWSPKAPIDLKPTEEVSDWVEMTPREYDRLITMLGAANVKSRANTSKTMALASEFCQLNKTEWSMVQSSIPGIVV